MMLNCLRPVVGTLLLVSPLAAFGQQLPDWTAKIRTDHPRLFFNADTWPEIKTRALEKGLPYQTLISSLLHQYSAGMVSDAN